MPPLSPQGWALPTGHALVSTATATQRDLVDVLARARTAELCGLLALTSSAWQGHMLLFRGTPLFARAMKQDQSETLLDRDAYVQLCLSFGPDPRSQLYLYRMDERMARALSGLFQLPTLCRRLESASELRFLLEIVGGCHFEGCVQFQAGDDRAIVLFHQGRPLGAYTAQERQIVTSLAGPLASILGKPNPDITFFPRPPNEPAPLPSSDSLNPGRNATLEHPTTEEPPRNVASKSDEPPALVSPWPAQRRGSTMPAESSANTKRSMLDNDNLAESHMLGLLTALDHQWGQLKENGLDDPAVLTSLASLVSQCLAKVEAARTRTPDVPANPLLVEEVVAYIQTRFPAVSSLRANGSLLDATPLVAEFRALNNRAFERAWLTLCAEALTAGLRMAFGKLVEQVRSETVRNELRDSYDLYLADVDLELHRFRAHVDKVTA